MYYVLERINLSVHFNSVYMFIRYVYIYQQKMHTVPVNCMSTQSRRNRVAWKIVKTLKIRNFYKQLYRKWKRNVREQVVVGVVLRPYYSVPVE